VPYRKVKDMPDHYIVRLGTWSNSRSIMTYTPGEPFNSEFDGRVLEDSEFRKFRLSWDYSTLKAEHHLNSTGWSDFMEMPLFRNKATPPRRNYGIDRVMALTLTLVGVCT